MLARFAHVFWERGLSTSTEATQLEGAGCNVSELGSECWGYAVSTRWLSDYAKAREGNGAFHLLCSWRSLSVNSEISNFPSHMP